MLGDKIRQHRKLFHMSQEELAEKLNVSRQSISLWENNQTQPTIENIIVISKLFGISTDELLSSSSSESDSHHLESDTVAPPVVTPTSGYVTVDSHVEDMSDHNLDIAEKDSPVKKGNRKRTVIIGVVVLAFILVLGSFVLWLITRDGNDDYNQLSAEDIFTSISPSVVEIIAESDTEISTGTGFFYDNKGTVITNYHVIEGCQSAEIKLTNGSTYAVTSVLGYDVNRDIAVLATRCNQSTPISIRTTPVKTGEKVYAIGSSLGLSGSLSDGIISAVDREVEGNVYIQTTAPISHGNSGGPLVDSNGKVIGIVCASFTEGQNLNLAIPIGEINKVSLNKSITLEELFPEAQREVEWISDWRFLYYADEDTYVLLFQLADKDEIPMSASGTVEIRIVNNDNVTVYSKTHTFTDANFEEWIYDDTDEMYLATIYISPHSISKGSTEYGTVYFVVYGNEYSFEECTEEVFDLPTTINSTPSTPPSEKYICIEPSCNNSTANSGEYCSTHRCATTGCPYSKDVGSNYCIVCVCGTVGCKNGRIANGYYCTEHTCAASGCTLEKEMSSDYCFSHQSTSNQGGTNTPTQQSCIATGCNNIVINQGNYCSEHKCANPSCNFKKEYNSDYCGSCTCKEIGCEKLHIDAGYYCTEHTCNASGCTSPKQYSSDYCITHKCFSCDNVKISGGSYCVDHTCSKNGCINDKQYGSEYCMSHTCLAGLCKNETLGDGDYCEEHTCIVPGCDKQKLIDDYCYYHTP